MSLCRVEKVKKLTHFEKTRSKKGKKREKEKNIELRTDPSKIQTAKLKFALREGQRESRAEKRSGGKIDILACSQEKRTVS